MDKASLGRRNQRLIDFFQRPLATLVVVSEPVADRRCASCITHQYVNWLLQSGRLRLREDTLLMKSVQFLVPECQFVRIVTKAFQEILKEAIVLICDHHGCRPLGQVIPWCVGSCALRCHQGRGGGQYDQSLAYRCWC